MEPELKAKRETKIMIATEIKIEVILENLIMGISEYDIRYGYSKEMPIPVIFHLENAKKEFQIMTHSQDHMNVGVSPRNHPNLKPYHQGMVGIKRMVAGGDTTDGTNTQSLFEVFVLKYPHFNPEKYGLKVKIAEVKTTSHTKYNINYHLIWIPKYRKSLLKGEVKQYLDEVIRFSCDYHGWECLALEIMPDHIHLFLSARPNWCPSKIVNILKGSTSKYLRDKFPRLKYLGYERRYKKFPNLWARGYYCGTAGHVSQEQVIRYIMEQEGSTPFNYDINEPQSTLEGF